MNDIFGRALARIPGWTDSGYQEPPVLIELTAKRWKALIVIAYILGWIGVTLIIWQLWAGFYRPLISHGFGVTGTDYTNLLSGAFIGVSGILGLVFLTFAMAIGFYARFMAWWRHG